MPRSLPVKTQELRRKLLQGLSKRRSAKAIERWLRRFLPLLEQLEDRLAPAGAVLQTDIPLIVGKTTKAPTTPPQFFPPITLKTSARIPLPKSY